MATRVPALVFAAALALAAPAVTAGQPGEAGSQPAAQSAPTAPTEIFGPAPPVPPAVIVRDASGVTLRATRIGQRIDIDGDLDEEIYEQVQSMSDFIQNDPVEGAPATERTEVWLLFDDDNVYVVARCWETRPDRIVANEMRRDNFRVVRDDNFAWSFDTFYDRRNVIMFEVTAVGGRIDAQTTNESQVNMDWNPIWDFSVGRFEGGWTMEAALPFKSLRYRAGGPQVWGFQARRVNRWKNESSYLTPLSAAQGLRGHFRASLAATLVGIDAPPASRLFEVKPYVIGDLTTNLAPADPAARLSNDPNGDFGIDAKLGVTEGLTADFTLNPDFAQVEADEQQINLTRFNLFFPEKREFFLENQGIFSFGGGATSGRIAGANDMPILFYSRRIGLEGTREVPLRAGGRLTGRAGAFTLGAINIHSGELLADAPVSTSLTPGALAAAAPLAPGTNFTVLRAKRDILRRSTIGLLFTGRSQSRIGDGSNEAYGADAVFGFYDDVTINTHWAQTRTPGLTGNDTSYRAQLDYRGDRYGVELEHLLVGDSFNPEIGFVRRRDMRRSYGLFRFSPRPQNIGWVRRFLWSGSFAYVENLAGQVETREATGIFTIELDNSDMFTVNAMKSYEFLPVPFPIARGVTLPVAGYDFTNGQVSYQFGPQRRIGGTMMVEHGTFYSGTKTAFTVSRGRASITNQFSVEPSWSINQIDLVEGSFTTNLIGSRITYTMTPLMFASALLQYNSAADAVSANVRFRWEYQPGSELFIVFNEQRDTTMRRFPGLVNRAFVVKFNRLFRF
ncbi:MAG: carbohydrate binding family 9 domain-containing protein [Acidobacteria bacterium]|nr:carbohydrate binding family 9 domain-containing protein [Acidobacteriota bacterium]MYD71149.1 carbohydrate binding family 9 domain-containing protein [Acidobacteriota bacterium]MYJ03843.1 carbohydrate binding family 9 domain-containing protein [Acidobacteriota bacterium]